ncbi:hypothetical protein D1164_04925 [Mariniphaga sediminis]|uniref:Uncharacterized protein n=1 Tax=Mariniphaga sediminis TaxID=1628158 RepID=A0A399D3W6_9BACT|nr:hypothetical protein D1164_04925 [Mariniphaga sediminis]
MNAKNLNSCFLVYCEKVHFFLSSRYQNVCFILGQLFQFGCLLEKTYGINNSLTKTGLNQ